MIGILIGDSYAILPNRTSGQTTVEMTLIESGQTELTVYDQIGNKIETIYSCEPDIGTQEVTLDLSQYANGRYYMKLTTPTISKTEILEVVRKEDLLEIAIARTVNSLC